MAYPTHYLTFRVACESGRQFGLYGRKTILAMRSRLGKPRSGTCLARGPTTLSIPQGGPASSPMAGTCCWFAGQVRASLAAARLPDRSRLLRPIAAGPLEDCNYGMHKCLRLCGRRAFLPWTPSLRGFARTSDQPCEWLAHRSTRPPRRLTRRAAE